MTINTILIFFAAMIVVSIFILLENRSKRNRVSPTNLGEVPFRIIKSILIFLLTLTLMAGSFLINRTTDCTHSCHIFLPGNLFCFPKIFSFPRLLWLSITFGWVSAYIGFYELDDYINDSGFWVALGIGALGTMLVFLGFWKTLFRREAN